MADTTTPTLESKNPGELKSSPTAMGPSQPPARRAKRGRKILLASLGLALIVIVHGAGAASLDRLISHRLEAKKA